MQTVEDTKELTDTRRVKMANDFQLRSGKIVKCRCGTVYGASNPKCPKCYVAKPK